MGQQGFQPMQDGQKMQNFPQNPNFDPSQQQMEMGGMPNLFGMNNMGQFGNGQQPAPGFQPNNFGGMNMFNMHQGMNPNQGEGGFNGGHKNPNQGFNNNNPNFNARYKTALCNNFSSMGQCKFGDSCRFAHGEEELRQVQHKPRDGFNNFRGNNQFQRGRGGRGRGGQGYHHNQGGFQQRGGGDQSDQNYGGNFQGRGGYQNQPRGGYQNQRGDQGKVWRARGGGGRMNMGEMGMPPEMGMPEMGMQPGFNPAMNMDPSMAAQMNAGPGQQMPIPPNGNPNMPPGPSNPGAFNPPPQTAVNGGNGFPQQNGEK